MKHCCRNCHFLAKRKKAYSYNYSWTNEERERGQVGDDYVGEFCWIGLWDKGKKPHLNCDLKKLLDKNRKNQCYFIEYLGEIDMSFPDIQELQRERNAGEARSQNTFFGKLGIYLAFVTIIINLYYINESIIREFIKNLLTAIYIRLTAF